MKKYSIIAFLFLAKIYSAQLITLSKAEKISDNKDKVLLKINPEFHSAEYLGEVHINGFSENDAEVFSKIYQKAKTIGANAFALKKVETIDGNPPIFDPADYRLNLYATTEFPKQDNIVYIFSSGKKKHKIRIDGKKIELKPRHFIKKEIKYQKENSISSGGFLGSKVNLSPKEGQPVQYFLINSFNIKSNQTSSGGLNIKSSDVIQLEQSYANFLQTIYAEQKL